MSRKGDETLDRSCARFSEFHRISIWIRVNVIIRSCNSSRCIGKAMSVLDSDNDRNPSTRDSTFVELQKRFSKLKYFIGISTFFSSSNQYETFSMFRSDGEKRWRKSKLNQSERSYIYMNATFYHARVRIRIIRDICKRIFLSSRV